MGEVLGLGMTHFPPLGWPDELMDRALQFGFADPAVPEAVRQGEGWPEGMREEFDRPRPEAAADHRAAMLAGCEKVRAELDAFAPDVVVIWGDDQYELFREDVVPAFCVVATETLVVRAVAASPTATRSPTCGTSRPTPCSRSRGTSPSVVRSPRR